MKVLSVTEILSKYQDFSNVPEDRLALACERGTAVHSYCAAYAKGLWVSVPADAEGYCKSFQTWFDEYVEEVLLVEEELADETLGFIGHPDLIARLKGDDTATVTDLKTPVALQAVWSAQLAAYRHLARVRYGPMVDRCGSLRLDPKGKPAKFKGYSDSRRDFMAFQNALYAHKYFVKGG